jgi:cellulose synthase/poly-beta-1,6-N-acetylglucosamine synthase-like glycosyltransferase
LVAEAGGWDEKCLTEDADIGIRLSTHGKRIAVTYDAEHTTREETPPTVAAFVRQRTRWNQGFLQVLKKGDWRAFPSISQRILGFYTLTYPFVQAFMALLWPLCVLMILAAKMPVWIAMISFLPLYGVAFQLLMNVVGLLEFGATYGVRVGVRDILRITLGFVPYHALLSLGALRAVYRELRGTNNWEKTAHSGVHRQTIPTAAERRLPQGAAARAARPLAAQLRASKSQGYDG